MANPIVTIEMESGAVMSGELYPEIAPNTVNNFIALANSGFYDGVVFHRVIPGFMIQGGCPEGTGSRAARAGTSRVSSCRTASSTPLNHTRGVISMARAMDPNSAGSQFFIMHQDAPHLDGSYAAFGHVVNGIEVVDEIANVATDWNDKPRTPVVMEKVEIV